MTAAALRQAVDALPDIGEIVLKAFLTRRTLLLSDGFEGIKIIGSRFSPDAHRLRDFATRNAIPFTWIDLESDEQAETLLRQFGVPRHRRAGEGCFYIGEPDWASSSAARA